MTSRTQSLVFVHPSDELYGADRMLLEQLSAVPDGVTVEVWLPNDLDHPDQALCVELERLGVAARHVDLPILRRAYRTPQGFVALARRAARLHRLIKAAAPDVIYCTTSAAALAAPVARWARVPTIIGHVQEIWTDSDRRVLVPVLRACHRLIAISDAVAAATSPALRPRMVVVPNATPEPVGVTSLEGREGPLVFVVASRWNGWKGHATLLAAWDRLDEGRLLVLGGPPLSGDRCDVPALVERLHRPDSVEIVGEVADAGRYLAEADVVVVPSDAPEPFGLIAIEAFARGRPVVASAGGGLLDIIEDQRNGWLFEPANAAALAEVLATLTRAAVTAAGSYARKTYESRYTTPEYATRWRKAVGLVGSTTEK